MLSDYLPLERITVLSSLPNWKEAIDVSVQPLVDASIVNTGYAKAIKSSIEALGPYCVIAPGIAMPHARLESGANAIGASLLLLKKGVCFGGNNDPVYIVMTFSATDKTSHIQLMQSLALFLSNESKALRKCESPEAISALIKDY